MKPYNAEIRGGEAVRCHDGLGACPYSRATFGARTQMEAPKTEALKAAIEAIAEKAKDANSPGEAMQFAQAALNLAHTAALLHNMK